MKHERLMTTESLCITNGYTSARTNSEGRGPSAELNEFLAVVARALAAEWNRLAVEHQELSTGKE